MRALGLFWAAVVAVLVVGVAVLQVLGPPEPPAVAAAGATRPAAEAPSAPVPETPPVAARPAWDGRIAPPDPALLEPSRFGPDAPLPRVAPDGRTPMRVYARPFDASDPRPRIGLVLAGIGLSDGPSREAVEALPGAVTLALSPYAPNPEPLLQAVRAAGHEWLMSLPMEPAGYPLNEAGNRSLLTGAEAAENERNLHWVLSRAAGYAGVTGASDGMRGERFVQAGGGFGLVAAELVSRGLFFVDARPGEVPPSAPGLAARGVDVVLDDPPARAEIEAKLAQLERLARERGSALGLAGPLRPVVLDRLVAWARGVEARGFVLAPVSALIPRPERPLSERSLPDRKAP